MKRLLAFVFIMACSGIAYGQYSKPAMLSQVNTSFPDNTVGAITPSTTRTFLNNLIASYQDNLQLNVKDYGAYGDCIHNDTTAINNAINALPANGGIVLFPAPTAVGGCYLISPITIGDANWSGGIATTTSTKSNIVLKGIGIFGSNTLDGSGNARYVKLKYDPTATAGGTMITFNGPGTFGMSNLDLDANVGRAGYGLLLKHPYYSTFDNLSINNFSNTGIVEYASPVLPANLFSGACKNVFSHLFIVSTGYNAINGIDIGDPDFSLGGTFDVCQDHWYDTIIEITDNASSSNIVLRGADNLVFTNTTAGSPLRTANGIKLIPPTGSSYYPSSIIFDGVTNITGPIVTPTDGTSWTPNGDGSLNLAFGLFFANYNPGLPSSPGPGQTTLPSNSVVGGIQGFTGDGRSLGTEPVSITVTNYVINSNMVNRFLSVSNNSSVTLQLLTPTNYNGFGPNWRTFVQNFGAGNVVITPTASNTINGAATLTLTKYQGATIYSTGTAYIASLFNFCPAFTGDVTTTAGSCATTLAKSITEHVSWQPGLLTVINTGKAGFFKIGTASVADNMTASASAFTCSVNPTITAFECGTSASCASGTNIGAVTLTAANTVAVGSITGANITAGDYIAFATTVGTCVALNPQVNLQIHQ